jgi:predicted permease
MLTCFLEEYLASYLVIMVYSGSILSSIITSHLFLALLFNYPQCATNVMGSTMSLPNTNCPGVDFSVVCQTERWLAGVAKFKCRIPVQVSRNHQRSLSNTLCHGLVQTSP